MFWWPDGEGEVEQVRDVQVEQVLQVVLRVSQHPLHTSPQWGLLHHAPSHIQQITWQHNRGFQLPITRALSANYQSPEHFHPIRMSQTVCCTNSLPCLAHKLKRCNGMKEWWIPNKIFRVSNSTSVLVTRDINCNQSSQSQ